MIKPTKALEKETEDMYFMVCPRSVKYEHQFYLVYCYDKVSRTNNQTERLMSDNLSNEAFAEIVWFFFVVYFLKGAFQGFIIKEGILIIL